MLAQLTIRNFALVDSLTLEFVRGFNVLTGETGAGKSILIDAITAALGERAGAELVRTGADRAAVEAVFEVDETFPPVVQEAAEEGTVILTREISASGRSSFRMNGRLCTAAAVREVASELIDLHGQHDHQSLLSPERQVEFLDAWAGKEVGTRRRRVQELHAGLRETRRNLDDLITGERERARQADLYRFQIEEIDAAGLREGEEDELSADRSRLANAERLFAAGAAAREALDQREVSAADLLSTAQREVEAMASLDAAAAPILELLEGALAGAQEAAAGLRGYLDRVEVNPIRLEQVQERLETYRAIKRKYGDTVAEVAAYRDRIAADLEGLEHSEERRAALEEQLRNLATQLDEEAGALHTARSSAAARFEGEIAAHLGDLNMSGTRFEVALRAPVPALAVAPVSRPAAVHEVLGGVEFLISANPGEPVRPLAKIASGGEISRVMLALKTVMAGSHPLALIFDEIDAGVGGGTAAALGAKMAELSRSNQVLCVTHMPQIASMAACHVEVSKSAAGDRTVVAAHVLDDEARVAELTRMLGGAKATAAQHARQLLASAGRGHLIESRSSGSHPERSEGSPLVG